MFTFIRHIKRKENLDNLTLTGNIEDRNIKAILYRLYSYFPRIAKMWYKTESVRYELTFQSLIDLARKVAKHYTTPKYPKPV